MPAQLLRVAGRGGRAEDAWLVGRLPGTVRLWVRFQACITDVMSYSCNPSSWEGEVGGPEVQGHSCIHIKFEANLGHTQGPVSERKRSGKLGCGRGGVGRVSQPWTRVQVPL